MRSIFYADEILSHHFFPPTFTSDHDKPNTKMANLNFDPPVLTARVTKSWESFVQVCVSEWRIRIAVGWTRRHTFVRQRKACYLYFCCATSTPVLTSEEEKILRSLWHSLLTTWCFTQHRLNLSHTLIHHWIDDGWRFLITDGDAAPTIEYLYFWPYTTGPLKRNHPTINWGSLFVSP